MADSERSKARPTTPKRTPMTAFSRLICTLVTVAVLLAVACRQSEVNGACGGLNGLCAGGMECIEVAASQSICLKPCVAETIDCPPPGCCPAGASCRPVDMVVKRIATTDTTYGVKHFCVPSQVP